jgi:hypothetical protein
MRSIGRTDSRMIASAFSTSLIRRADILASGESMLCASFIRRSASASISARTRIAIDLILSASASASAWARIAAPRSALASFSARAALVRRRASRSAAWREPISSIAFFRSAISTSRAVNTFSSAVTASARAVSAGRLGDALRFAFLRHRDRPLLLGELERHAPFDLRRLDRSLLADPLLLDRLLGADARRIDRLLGGDLRALALLLALRPLGHELGALPGARDLDLALLAQARVLALAVDLERELLGLEVLVADRDQGVLLDVVALLLALLDRLGEARQALGVEGVARVEELHAGLVELGQRHRLELEAVLGQVLGHRLAHPAT